MKVAERDLGFVEPNSKHTVAFEVDNPSPKAIEIRRIRSECKCMGVPKPPRSIPAGGQARVEMSFKAPAEALRYSKRILLVTNDAELEPSSKPASFLALSILAPLSMEKMQ